jgi:lysophospholipase L1-like esterase
LADAGATAAPAPAPGGPALALGDSIMSGPEEGSYSVPPRAWPQWIAELLDLPFHRIARPGASAPDLVERDLSRIRDDYAVACVGIGTNDVRSIDWDATRYTRALDTLLTAVAARSDRRCVATVPLDLGRPRAGAKVEQLNAIVRDLARSHGFAVVALDDFGGWRWWFPDAVHPTALGQLEIARRAARALGIDRDPALLAPPERGPRSDLRYAATRQIGHLWRDRRRRCNERNV